jgi:molybdopterin biosynthesis enzyme
VQASRLAGTPVAEPVPVQDGLGRVTAAAVRARWSVPRFACAAMDGVAIAFGALAPQAGEVGVCQLAAGAFVPVDTGDPMPADTDTVIAREHVARHPAGRAAPAWRRNDQPTDAGRRLVADPRRAGPLRGR